MSSNKKIETLQNVFNKTRVFSQGNAVNTLEEIHKLKVLVWTFSKTGTMTISKSFQHKIDGTFKYKNVSHCHHESCWYNNITKELENIGFSFKMLVEYLNTNGIHPLVVQSFRCPVERFVSDMNHRREIGSISSGEYSSLLRSPGHIKYINYLKETFDNIWQHKYDKNLGYGFHRSKEYDILYLTCDTIDKLPENINLVKELKEYHDIKIHNTNIRNGSQEYKKFKTILKLTLEDIEYLYDTYSQPLKFFYTSDKIFEMKQKAIKKYVKN